MSEREARIEAAVRKILTYPGPVHLMPDSHETCTPDECYVAELRAALDSTDVLLPPDPADLARWLQEWAESQPAITIRQGVEPQVAWRALADELLRRWGR